MKWNVRKRLEFIESRLLWEEKISRKDLVDFFDISIPQATKDFKLYQEKAPENLVYNTSAKQYEANENLKPAFISGKSELYLSQLLIALLSKAKAVFSCGSLPPAYQLPNPGRVVEEKTLKAILNCIHNNCSLKILYQSMNRPEPIERWVTPHALGFDGHRWHARSLCHEWKEYRDFNMGRIISVLETIEGDYDHSNDFLWYSDIVFKISTHEDLTESQKACVERDYNMTDGKAEIPVKAAFEFYMRQRLNLTKNHELNPAKEQQIILLNGDEIETQVRTLKEIERTRLESVNFIN